MAITCVEMKVSGTVPGTVDHWGIIPGDQVTAEGISRDSVDLLRRVVAQYVPPLTR